VVILGMPDLCCLTTFLVSRNWYFQNPTMEGEIAYGLAIYPTKPEFANAFSSILL
jgi:hypothetical protein